MSNEEQIEQVELTIDQARKSIDRMHAFEDLRKNGNFQKLIEDGYFKDEASRLVLLLADPSMQSEEVQKSIHQDIIGIGALHQYFKAIYQMGRTAERAMAADEKTLEELHQEGIDS